MTGLEWVILVAAKAKWWLLNRVLTWSGLFYAWRRWRHHRHTWVWLLLANVISLGILVLLWNHIQ